MFAHSRTSAADRQRQLETLPDDELCTRCVHGDRLAWETLVRRYQRLVYAIPARAGLRGEQVEEVFHTTFSRLAERIASIRDRERLRAWIVTTARHLTIDVIREKRSTLSPEESARALERVPDSSPAVDDVITSLERRHLLWLAVRRLDERCRRIIELLFYDSSDPPPSYESIAAEIGMPLGSLGPTRARCLKKLLAEFRALERE